jgi:hypothetical protein
MIFQTQVVLASGALPTLLSLLSSPKEVSVKKPVEDISTSPLFPQAIQAIVLISFPPLLNIFASTDFQGQKEACWACRTPLQEDYRTVRLDT